MADYQVPHTYTRGCPRVIASVQDGDQRAMALVELTGCVSEIIAAVERAPDDDTGYVVELTYEVVSGGTATIRWDGTSVTTGNPSSGTVTHAYAEGDEGVHTVMITDESNPDVYLTLTFDVPLPPRLDLLVRPAESDTTGYTAEAVWGEGLGPEPPDDLALAISPDGETGYTVRAAWTQTGGTP